MVEIQVRTLLQHLWANLSEKLADMVDPAVKYGGGPANVRELLDGISREIWEMESLERGIASHREGTEVVGLPDDPGILEKLEAALSQKTADWTIFLRDIRAKLDHLRE